MKKDFGISTRSVHSGERTVESKNSVTVPIVQSSTYSFEDTEALCAFMEGRVQRGAEYGRYGNPTQKIAEEKLADLDGAQDALLLASGMSAITITLLALLRQGEHLVITRDSYRKTKQFLIDVLSKFGVDFSIVEPTHEDIEKNIRPNTTIILTESPTNPYLNVLDIEKVAAIAKERGIISVIDSTFATPYNQRPLEYGIDLVIHSATKYLAGHNDLLAGVVLGKKMILSAVRDYQGIIGSILDPHACYLLLRGLKTFAIRMKTHNENGMSLARFLEKDPRISKVYYPGLESHESHGIAVRQMSGYGGVISFEVNGTLEDTSKVIDAVNIPYIAPSLGGVEALIEQPSLMSYYDRSPEEREELGIKNNLIRYSCGVENAEDLINDLEQALSSVFSKRT